VALLRNAGLGVVAALLLNAGAALAHARLLASEPAAGARLKGQPALVVLTFSEPLTLAFSGLALERGGGAPTPLMGARLKGPKTIEAPLPSGLTPGAYVLRWQAVSTDSHRTEGSVPFTIAAP
jgi:methionine-rich copper-binding protein CopC